MNEICVHCGRYLDTQTHSCMQPEFGPRQDHGSQGFRQQSYNESTFEFEMRIKISRIEDQLNELLKLLEK